MNMCSLLKNLSIMVAVSIIYACGGDQEGQDSTEAEGPMQVEDMPMQSGSTMAMGPGDPESMSGTQGMSGMGAMSGMGGMESPVETDALDEARLTENGQFRVRITPQTEPVPINQMQEWILHLETPAGEPVEDASITIAGGMPAHNHGMPTAPQVTATLGDGDYQIEGVQFQMPGHWEVSFDITSGSTSDSVTYTLMLQP